MGISPDQWAKVKEIYENALECTPVERFAYVERHQKTKSYATDFDTLIWALSIL